MLGRVGVRIKSCRNGILLYIYSLGKSTRLSQNMRLLIGVIRWGAVYSTITLSEDKHGVNGLFDHFPKLGQTWDKLPEDVG
jgi:hypothetical protein